MQVLQRLLLRKPAQMYAFGRAGLVLVLSLLCAGNLLAQTGSPELRQILERLEGVERSNRELTEEVRALRTELAAAKSQPGSESPNNAKSEGPDPEEQLAVLTQRTDELAQTKVESGQRFPIRIKGMLLFNTYLNSKQAGGERYPSVAVNRGVANGGATLEQSVIGFDYQGPEVFGGGKVRASLLMDFYGSSGQPLDEALRIRTATMQIDWKTRSLLLGMDKPIFAPREPNSFAQVEVSPLTGAGNLWMWLPQIRFQQSFRWSDVSQVRAQIGIVQTREISSYQTAGVVAVVEPARPGLEGRVELSHDFGAGRRIELAPGFHFSTSHVAQTAVPSRLFSMDWLVSPWRKFDITGAFFAGENVAHLGNGGIGQGFAVAGPQQATPLHARGGWAQFAWMPTERLSFHLFSGLEDDRNRDLPPGQIGLNLAYGANVFYRLAPNVIMSLETSQVRTSYIQNGRNLNNHYDLAFAYIF
jgi:hypothetical protein